ncbi:MAG: ribonuclease HII [Lachnospiraceae bacterium]|nr:ribonuclease HII [Lachnospiraceae bacterium]
MKSISEINAEFKACDINELKSFIDEYVSDERGGVKKIINSAEKKIEALENEKKRIYALSEFERKYNDYGLICGIDEVGRGPLAGPVVAGAVILPKDCDILYINDSKKLSEKMREALYDEIEKKAVACSVGYASPERIDEINILQATYEAMREAIAGLSVSPDLLLNDAVTIPMVSIKQVPIIKGDAKSISIGAASIYAKVTRDRLMYEYDKKYPEYGFAKHVGYGTKEHIDALKKFGPCPIHRRTFIKNFCD